MIPAGPARESLAGRATYLDLNTKLAERGLLMGTISTFQLIALSVDLFAMSLVFGATAWFFFVQSPALFKSMGKERFVPLQMRLTVLFFNTMTIALSVMLIGSVVQTGGILTWPTITAAMAFGAIVINKVIVVPKALRAGGRSRTQKEGRGATNELADFASKGAGQSTKLLHRLVVLFVVFMVGGLVAHGITLVVRTPIYGAS